MSQRVSILLPVFNGGTYLSEFLETALAQSHQNFELLACDDASTDGSLAVLRQHERDKRVRVFRNDSNLGLNGTWHRLLQEMTGAWWCCPGADDLWDQDFLHRRLAICAADPEIGVVHGAARIIDEHGKFLAWDHYPQQIKILSEEGRRVPSSQMFRLLLEHNYIIQPSVLANSAQTRSVLSHFQTHFRYAPDWYLWLLLAGRGADFAFDPDPRMSYRVHTQSLSKDSRHAATRRVEVRLAPLLALQHARIMPEDTIQSALESLLLARLLTGPPSACSHLKTELTSAWTGNQNATWRLLRAFLAMPRWWKQYGRGARNNGFPVSGIPRNFSP